MHRIDHPTAVSSLPAPLPAGTPGFYTEGSPSGQAATTFTADAANALQEEVCYVIEQSGLALNKADNTQLRAAIAKMISDAAKAIRIDNATFAAGVVTGDAVRWDVGAGNFAKAVADGTTSSQAAGFADVANSKVYGFGEAPGLFAGLTPGARYYLSDTTSGAITTTAPADRVLMGIAKSATTLFVDIDSGLSSLELNRIKLADGVTPAFDNANIMIAGNVPLGRMLRAEGSGENAGTTNVTAGNGFGFASYPTAALNVEAGDLIIVQMALRATGTITAGQVVLSLAAIGSTATITSGVSINLARALGYVSTILAETAMTAVFRVVTGGQLQFSMSVNSIGTTAFTIAPGDLEFRANVLRGS